MAFNTTFNNISVIAWRSVLLVDEIRVPEENHRPVARHWQIVSHNVASSTPCLSWIRTHMHRDKRQSMSRRYAFAKLIRYICIDNSKEIYGKIRAFSFSVCLKLRSIHIGPYVQTPNLYPNLAGQVSLMGQELAKSSGALALTPDVCGVPFSRSLVFCVVHWRWLFDLFLWAIIFSVPRYNYSDYPLIYTNFSY